MYVLLLSIFMAGRINSVCVKHSQIQTREVILVNVFAGNSLRHHWEFLLHCGKLYSSICVMSDSVLCHTF